MKILDFIIILTMLTACSQSAIRNEDSKTAIADTLRFKTALLRVEGMTCTSCENTIQLKVGMIQGVKKVKASYTDSLTTVIFDTSVANIVLISETINKLGYKVVGEIPL